MPLPGFALRRTRTARGAVPTSHSPFRRKPEHDIPAGGEFAGLGSLERIEGERDALTLRGVLDAFVDHVVRVQFMALDVALGDELLLALDLHGEVDVRGARLIRHGLDGAEDILAVRTGEESSEALEITIPLGGVAGLGVEVSALVIGLPDFDQGIAHRIAMFVEDATGQPSDLADGRRDAVVHDDEVVVRIERQLVGIERTLRLLRRACQRLGESARHREHRRP